MKNLSNDEISVLHEVLVEETVYASPGKWSMEDKLVLESLQRKVNDEAKRRGFWWAS